MLWGSMANTNWKGDGEVFPFLGNQNSYCVGGTMHTVSCMLNRLIFTINQWGSTTFSFNWWER